MKNLFFALLIISGYSSLLYSQNYNWITPNKTYLKLYVADDGICRLTKTDFTNAGISTSGIDPRTVKLYNKGSQIPVYFYGESDGVFNDSDYIDFYGTRNYGGLSNVYNQDNQVMYVTNEWNSLYSDTNVYWIDWGGSNGIRMANSSFSSSSDYSFNFSNSLLHREQDKIYWIGQATNSNDFGNFTNERYLGESWYWTLLGNTQSLSDTFSLPLLYKNQSTVSLRVFAYPQNVSLTVFNEHTLQIKINGTAVSTFTRNDFDRIDTTIFFPDSLLSESSVNTVTATYTSNGGFSGNMFIDLFELNIPQKLKFRNSFAKMKLAGADTVSKKIKLSGFNSSAPVYIYDVSNNIRISAYSVSSDTLIFSAKQNCILEIINKNITKKPIRIIQRQVPDLVSASNGVDYLIIYPKIFESQVIQLQNHRETYDNFRVKKAEMQDIYDIFNYGIEDPDAVRNFTRYVYYNWQLPRIKYICLFGRGSLDPKKNSSATVYSNNLVPVKGNPSSDNYFSNVNTGTFIYYNQIAIGRLPAYTSAEAQNMVNNIITYETQQSQSWWKDFTFIGGGVNLDEQNLFYTLNYDSLINPYVLPVPLKGNPVNILRNDLNGAETFNYSDSIKNQINRGTLMVNFMGHAGSQDWEIGLQDPSILNNSGRFPIIFSMTCYTGKVGEPNFRSFGERFMNMNNKGAVAFFATAGWGFIYSGSFMNTSIYKAFAKDSVRRVGDLIKSATNTLKSDSISFSIRHSVNCYTLMGDPALKIQMPRYPEFSISQSDYKLSSSNPSVNENVTLKIYPKNIGTNSDSCLVRLLINKNFTRYLTKDVMLRNFSNKDSVSFDFRLNSKGIYKASVILDLNNYSPNENKNDNTINFDINVKNVSFVPFKPVNNSVVRQDTVEYTGLNPFINKAPKNITLLLQTDTTGLFNSPVKQLFVNNSPSGVITKFKTLLPVRDTSKVYYWRTNSVIDGDSSGWSSVQIFKYNPLLSASDKSEQDASDTVTTIYRISSPQFAQYELSNTSYNSDNNINGIKINEFNGNLYVKSYGSNGSEASYFSVLDKSIHIDAGGNTGLNLIKVRKVDGKILQFRNFKMLFANSSDSVLNFLNTFDTTHYLMGLNAAYVANTFLLNTNVISKFAQFGSTKIANFRIGFFDTWSFIGYLGASQSDVSETVNRYITSWTLSESSLIKKFRNISGSITINSGPANAWKNFSWNNVLLPSNKILFDVYGVKNDGSSDLLLQNISTNANTDLSSVNAVQYPTLNLTGKLTIDTLTGNSSPALTSFKLNYRNPAETSAELDELWKSDSTAYSGKEIKVRFRYYNAGDLDIPGYVAKVYMLKNYDNYLIRTDTVNVPVQKNNSVVHESKFTVPSLRTGNVSPLTFYVEILPKGNFNEAFTFNNYVYFNLTQVSSGTAGIEVFSDGKRIENGDNVSLKPEIKIVINNNPDLSSSDSHSELREVFLNGVSIIRSNAADKTGKIPDNSGRKSENRIVFQNEIMFYPELIKGENKLRILSGNSDGTSDTVDFSLNVSGDFTIDKLYNFPNPMRSETNFMFDLTGFEDPGSCIIKIYTISGRLIRQIDIPANIGFNTVSWDGKDSDGDNIANGTYLYKLLINGSKSLESEVRKLVVLR